MNEEEAKGESVPGDDSKLDHGWCAREIRIGRIVMLDVQVKSREGAINLSEVMQIAIEKTRRSAKGSSRYLEHVPSSRPTRMLSVEIEDYLSDMSRRRVSQELINKTGRYLGMLLKVAGDIPVSRVDANHIRQFWDHLRWWPHNARKSIRFRGLSDEEILRISREENTPAPASATIAAAHRIVATFFNRLVDLRVLSFNVLDAFGKPADTTGTARRRPFTDEELTRIFDPDTYVPWATLPHRWWCPILALYTGARIGEIAQLKVDDVIRVNGVWCLDIHRSCDDDLAGNRSEQSRQRLKTSASTRVIVLSQQVIGSGFLDFVEDAREFGHQRLFPHLSGGNVDENGELVGHRYSTQITAQFVRYLDKHCPMEKGLGAHVFRHYFATTLTKAGVDEAIIATMTGHVVKMEKSALKKHYIHALDPTTMQNQIQALAQYSPPVVLPRYQRGQFANTYRRNVRIYE